MYKNESSNPLFCVLVLVHVQDLEGQHFHSPPVRHAPRQLLFPHEFHQGSGTPAGGGQFGKAFNPFFVFLLEYLVHACQVAAVERLEQRVGELLLEEVHVHALVIRQVAVLVEKYLSWKA